MQPIRYLIQLHDNSIYGYEREDILRCHLVQNKDCPPKLIFRLSETSLTISYDIIDISEIAPSLSLSSPPPSISLVEQIAA